MLVMESNCPWIPMSGWLMEKLLVQVVYKQQCEHLVIAVVAGDGPSLLIGRNWLKHICLDRNSIWTVTHADDEEGSLKSLLRAHKEFFKDEPGTTCSFQAKLHVRPDACPKFFKPQTMSFAINEAIEQELDRLEVNGVIGRWHTANGSCQLCQCRTACLTFVGTTRWL